jgi:hypothetical protein
MCELPVVLHLPHGPRVADVSETRDALSSWPEDGGNAIGAHRERRN